jgi:hypothetical protein
MADWFYAQGSTQRGPVDLNFLVDALRSGTLNATDLVWRDGMAQWTPAGQVPELAGAVGTVNPPMQPTGFAAPFAPAMAPAMTPNYSQPYYPPASSQHSGLAITSMVLGIVSFCCLGFGFLTAIPALICGIIALNGMKRTGDARGRGMAITGIVLGSVYLALGVLSLILYILLGASMHHANMQSNPPFTSPSHQWSNP